VADPSIQTIMLANILDEELAPAMVTDVLALRMVVLALRMVVLALRMVMEVLAMVKVVEYWPGSRGGGFCDRAVVMIEVATDSCVGGIGLACGDGGLFF